VHCRWAYWLERIPVGTHCGLTIITDEGRTAIDGGGTSPIQLRERARVSNPGNEYGETVDYPDSVCECLRDYIRVFNDAELPRGDLAGNSNWALHCLVSHCNIEIDWGDWGPPVGYYSPPCKEWETVFRTGPHSSVYRRCVKWYACP